MLKTMEIVLAVQTFITVLLYLCGLRRYRENKEFLIGNSYPFRPVMPCGYALIAPVKLRRMNGNRIFMLYHKRYNSIEKTVTVYKAYLASVAALCLLLCDVLTVMLAMYAYRGAAKDDIISFAVFGILIIAVCAFGYRKRELSEEKRRVEAIVGELPMIMNKVVVLLGSGKNMVQIIKQLGLTASPDCSPLYEELRTCAMSISDNTRSSPQALKEMQQRCPDNVMSKFVNALIQNITKGTDGCSDALMELSHELWREKKTSAKIRNKKTKSLLLIPTFIVFVVVMALCIIPVVMQLESF